jgi:hypothetical protein
MLGKNATCISFRKQKNELEKIMSARVEISTWRMVARAR